MGLKNYKEDIQKEKNNKGRFDRMVESDWEPIDAKVDEKEVVNFNIDALAEKRKERKRSFSYTLKPSLDEKIKKLANEKGYSNKSSFMSAIIEALPDPKE